MKNSLLQHALNSLAHPVSIGAAIFLLFNALIWQRFWPSWWTGKIGDFAWMVIGPFLVVLLLVLCLPTFFRDNFFVGISAVFITGAGFGLLKIWLPLNTLVTTWLGNLGFTLKLSADPSDLISTSRIVNRIVCLAKFPHQFAWKNNSPWCITARGFCSGSRLTLPTPRLQNLLAHGLHHPILLNIKSSPDPDSIYRNSYAGSDSEPSTR